MIFLTAVHVSLYLCPLFPQISTFLLWGWQRESPKLWTRMRMSPIWFTSPLQRTFCCKICLQHERSKPKSWAGIVCQHVVPKLVPYLSEQLVPLSLSNDDIEETLKSNKLKQLFTFEISDHFQTRKPELPIFWCQHSWVSLLVHRVGYFW